MGNVGSDTLLRQSRPRPTGTAHAVSEMRYEERSLQLIDLIGRFEAKSSAEHGHTAIAALQRLRDNGREYCQSDPQALKRWNSGCDVLIGFLNGLGTRTKQPLETVMREFVQEFEHSVGRMYQLLFSGSVLEGKASRERYLSWVEFIVSVCTYAILSSRIEDKTEETSISIRSNLTTGEVSETWNHKPMTVPKKYRQATKPI